MSFVDPRGINVLMYQSSFTTLCLDRWRDTTKRPVEQVEMATIQIASSVSVDDLSKADADVLLRLHIRRQVFRCVQLSIHADESRLSKRHPHD